MKNKLFLLMAILVFWSQPSWAGSAVTVSDKIFDAPCRTLGIPKALAMAIAKVESNFRPWILNIEGQSFLFDSREEALNKAREAREAGRSFDTGLMQVNDWWLRKYRIPLEAAIDPLTNIYIGGWILKQELARHGGNVPAAVGAYHSPTPARANRYAKLVLSVLDGAPRHQAAPRSARTSETRLTTPKTAAPMLVAAKHKTLAQSQSLKASATAVANSMKVNL
jgi:soluble lytic murein transglycosylase-like protein